MNPAEVTARTAPLVRYLQANGTAQAQIVLVEGSPAGLGWASKDFWPGRNPGNVALRGEYEALVRAGVPRLHYVRSEELYARSALYGDGGDVTMAGVHPSDIGTRAIAEFWIGYLPAILPGQRVKSDDVEATTAVELFRFGDGANSCVRIPSLLSIPGSGVVLALAECREFVGDGCYPWANDNATLHLPGWGASRYICSRRSTDYGRSFGPNMHNITKMRSWNPSTLWDPRRKQVLLIFNDASSWLRHRPDGGGTPWLVRSSTQGLSWSAAKPFTVLGPRPHAASQGFDLGPGRALALQSGRIVVGGATSKALGECPSRPDGGICKQLTSFVLYSDTGGDSWRVSSA